MELCYHGLLLLFFTVHAAHANTCPRFFQTPASMFNASQCTFKLNTGSTCHSCCPGNSVCCDNGECMPFDPFCRYPTTCCAKEFCGDRCCSASYGTACGKKCAPLKTHQCCDNSTGVMCSLPSSCCGSALCCTTSETCINGNSCCPNAKTCGDDCCDSSQICAADLMGHKKCCASGSSLCDDKCCQSGHYCDRSSGQEHCCATGTTWCPSANQCCPQGTICLDGKCCSSASTCGSQCCSSAEHCTDDKICCPNYGETICNGACCRVGSYCENNLHCCQNGTSWCVQSNSCCAQCLQYGPCCQAEETVCGNKCCRQGESCSSGHCCASGQNWCSNGVGGGECCTGKCTDGLCCSSSRSACNNNQECCQSNQKCLNGMTCCDTDKICDINKCCAQDETCKKKHWWDGKRTCEKISSPGTAIAEDDFKTAHEEGPSTTIISPSSYECFQNANAMVASCTEFPCLDSMTPCDPDESFLQDMHTIYCVNYAESYKSFNTLGKKFLDCAVPCVEKAFYKVYQQDVIPCCSSMKDWAQNIGIHDCYKHCDFCTTYFSNAIPLSQLYNNTLITPYSIYYKYCNVGSDE